MPKEYKFVEINEMKPDELERLFQYEDFLKELVLTKKSGMLLLKTLQKRLQKIYVVPTAKSEQHI